MVSEWNDQDSRWGTEETQGATVGRQIRAEGSAKFSQDGTGQGQGATVGRQTRAQKAEGSAKGWKDGTGQAQGAIRRISVA